MKLPFVYLFGAAAVGNVLGQRVEIWAGLALPGMVLGLYPLWRMRGRKLFFPLYLVLLGVLAALMAQGGEGGGEEQPLFLFAPERTRLNVEGVVLETPRIRKEGRRTRVSFPVEVEYFVAVTPGGAQRSALKARLQVFLMQPAEIPRYGDRVLLNGRLREPDSNPHPYGFDYAGYLKSMNMDALFEGVGFNSVRVLERRVHGPGWRLFVEDLRMELDEVIRTIWAPPTAGIFKALILGMRNEIPPHIRDAFSRTGTAHLLAISGLHVSLLGIGTLCCLLLAGYRKRGAAVLALMVVFFYAAVSGWGIPARRASLTLCAVFAAFWAGRDYNPANILFLIAFALLLVDPGILTNVSFQLSFMCVLSLTVFSAWQWKPLQGVGMRQTAVILAGTFPVLVYHFGLFSPAGLIANPLAIPLFYWALLSGFLAVTAYSALPWAAVLLGQIAGWALHAALWVMDFLADLSFSSFHVKRPGMIHFFMYYTALGLLRVNWKEGISWTIKGGTLIFFTLSIMAYWVFPSAPDFRFHIVPYSKGAYAHFSLGKKHDWLVCFQNRLTDNYLRWDVEPYLRGQGVNRLEAVFLQTNQTSQSGRRAVELLSRRFSPQYWFYFRQRGGRSGGGDKVRLGKRDRVEVPGKAGLEVLEMTEAKKEAVVEVFYREFHLWIVPDMDRGTLERLLTRAGKSAVDVFWFQKAFPEKDYARQLARVFRPAMILTSGWSEEDLAEIKKERVPVYKTEQTGMVSFKSMKEGGVRVVSYTAGELARIR